MTRRGPRKTLSFARLKPGENEMKAALSLPVHIRKSVLLRGGNLFEVALSRFLIEAPAQEPGAMTEAAATVVIVLNFSHEPGLQGFPFSGALGAPAAGPTGRIARKTRGLDQRLQNLR